MRKFLLLLASVTALSLPFASTANAADRNAQEVVVTSRMDTPDRGAYVFYDSNEKLYVNARCKADLVEAGNSVRTVAGAEAQARSNVPSAQADDCDAIAADLADGDTGGDGGDDGGDMGGGDDGGDMEGDDGHATAGPVLHVTSGTTAASKGGYVVVDDETYSYVNSSCKADLHAADIPTQSTTFRQIKADFSRDNDSTCEDFLHLLTHGSDPDDPHDPDDPDGHPDGEWVKVTDEHATYDEAREATRYYLFDPDDHEDPTWGTTRIGWLVDCDSVLFRQVDPIVAPGQTTSAHMHEFFGNANVTPHTTTQSLTDTPSADIECTDVNDKSAYWSPAVFQDGTRITAEKFKAYYKSTTPETVPMPLGLRMVAGDAHATGNQDEQIGWWEEQRTNDLTPREDLENTIGDSEMIRRSNTGRNVVLRINFPNCWDGMHLDSPDHQSHMAYFDEETLTCPATHPVKLPQLVTFTQYDTAGGSGFGLASGEWYTFHQDFWNAWSPEQMDELNDECILAELNCRVNKSNALQSRGQYDQYIPERS